MDQDEINKTLEAFSYDAKTLPEGSATYVAAAFDPKLKNHNGAYLADSKVRELKGDGWAAGKDNEDKLWALSEKLVEEKFNY